MGEIEKKEMDLEAELLKYGGEDKVISSLEMNELLRNEQRPEVKVMSNMPKLDRLINGFNGGELVVISGKTKEGKTTLAQTLTWHFIMQDVMSLWFSYELPARDFLKKFPELPLFYMPAQMKPGIIWWVEKRIIEAKLKFGIRVVFIDHLHYVVDMAKMKNASIEIGAVVRQLKSIAIRQNIIIFLICHTAKTKEMIPVYEDTRDSSFIAQECDTFLMIWRMEENLAGLSVELSRRVGTSRKRVRLELKDGFFKEI